MPKDTLTSAWVGWGWLDFWPFGCRASTIILISILRTISNRDVVQDGRAAAWLAAGGAGRGRWSAGASTEVAARNPSAVAAPTAYQGYCWVHQLMFATSLAVACISTTVCCMAVLASAACWARNTRSSLVL